MGVETTIPIRLAICPLTYIFPQLGSHNPEEEVVLRNQWCAKKTQRIMITVLDNNVNFKKITKRLTKRISQSREGGETPEHTMIGPYYIVGNLSSGATRKIAASTARDKIDGPLKLRMWSPACLGRVPSSLHVTSNRKQSHHTRNSNHKHMISQQPPNLFI